MGEIFSKARLVAVWLGSESTDSDLAIDRLHELHRTLHEAQERDGPQSIIVDVGDETPSLRPDLVKPCLGVGNEYNSRSWTAMGNLLRRPWFSRLWVIQEATALSETKVRMYRGRRDFALFLISHYLRLLFMTWNESYELDRTIVAPNVDCIYAMTNIGKFSGRLGSSSKRRQRLSFLLTCTEQFKTSDPRDRLFCLLHSASDVARDESYLRIDYSFTLHEVCLRYVVWHLRTYHNLDFLGRCFRKRIPRPSQWPRWLPDLSQGEQAMRSARPKSFVPHTPSTGKDRTWVKASGTFADSISICTDVLPQHPVALALSGVRVGKVCQRFEVNMVLDPDWTESMQRKVCTLNRISMLKSFLQAAAGGREEATIDMVNDVQLMHSGPHNEYAEYAVKEKLSVMFPQVRYRSFFYTGGPWDVSPRIIGLGPTYGPVNAEIWMLKGGKALYLLAPDAAKVYKAASVLDITGNPSSVKDFNQSDTLYHYIGECFIPGLMRGELLDFMRMEPKLRPAALEDMDNEFRTIHMV